MLRLTFLAALLAAVAAAPAYATPTELMPGVTYDKQLVLSRFGPQVVHVVSAPRPGGLYTVGPVLSNAVIPGREPVTAIERRLAPTATMIGVNGDFSTTDGVPAGLVIQGGVLNAQPNVKRSSVGWDAAGTMRVERPGLNATWQGSGQRRSFTVNRRSSTSGTTLYTPAWGTATPVEPGSTEVVLPGLGTTVLGGVRSATVSEVRSGGGSPIPPGGAVLVGRGTSAQRIAEEAKAGTLVTIRLVVNPDWSTVVEGLAGGPVLVRGGKAVFNAREDFSPAALAARSARVAVGQRADGTILLMVVDGGLPGFSVGMTNYELAQTLVRQGAVTAAALEGGPAATLAFDGSLLNRPASGERAVSELLAVQYAGVYAPPPQPALLSPNGDGVEESQTFRYRLVRPAAVTVSLVDPVGAARVVESAQRAPGTYTIAWTGKKADGTLEQQGAWHWLVTAKDDLGRDSTADRPFTLDATLGALRITPTTVPVGKSGGSLGITFTLAAPAAWRVTIESRSGVVLRTYTGRSSAPGPVSLRWDGRYRKEVRAYAGSHVVRVTTTSEFGTAALTAPFTVRRTGR
jgi:hypothetical protein